ncbi:MAG: hypothetical protein ACI4UE_01995 [Candidatus Scatovivens sp.]
MKKIAITIFLLFLIILLSFTFKIYATQNNDNNTLPNNATEETTNNVSETTSYNNVTYTPQTSNNSPYVTSVSPVSSQYEANLGLNNILSILLISIGILLILFSIAILIRIKK